MNFIYSFCPNLIISTRNIVIKFRFRLCIRDWRCEISLPTAGVQFVSWGTAGGGSDTTCFLYQTVHSSFLNCWLRYLNLYWVDTWYFWNFVEFWSGSSVMNHSAENHDDTKSMYYRYRKQDASNHMQLWKVCGVSALFPIPMSSRFILNNLTY